MSIDAMKQALEALEMVTVDAKTTPNAYEASRQAITALRAAIEDAEKPWVKTYAGGQPNYTAPRQWQGLSPFDKTLLRTTYAPMKPLYYDKENDHSVCAEVVTDWDSFFAAIESKLQERNP